MESINKVADKMRQNHVEQQHLPQICRVITKKILSLTKITL